MKKATKAYTLRFLSICFLCILAGILFYRCIYSFSQSDESFYSALPHRLFQGDALIVDEWQVASVYSILLLPFYAIYKLIIPSGDGILLFFRILQVFFSFSAALLLLHSVKQIRLPALAAVCLCLLYSRANISGVSYYNLCFVCIITAYSLLSKASIPTDGHQPKTITMISVGVLIACAVLCNPFLAIPTLVILLITILRDHRSKGYKYAICGILLILIPFIIFLLSRSTPGAIIKSIPYFLNDPQHQSSIIERVVSFLYSVYLYFPLPILIWIALFSSYVLISIYKYHKKPAVRFMWFYLFSICALFGLLITHINDMPCFAFTFYFAAAVFPFIIYKDIEAKNNTNYGLLYLIGIMVALCFLLASNTVFDAMTVGFTICVIAGLLAMNNVLPTLKESSQGTKVLQRIIVCSLAIILSAELLIPSVSQRIIGIYRDAPISSLDTVISAGPAKGLKTTKEHAQQYDAIHTEILALSEEAPESYVLYTKWLPWAYLCGDLKCGSFTSWTASLSDPRLEQWYSFHPDRLPRYVVVLHDEVGAWEKSDYNSHEGQAAPNENAFDGWMYEYIQTHQEEVRITEYADIYVLSPDGITEY